MFTYIPDLLSAEERDRLTPLLAKAGFTDGALTAGWNAKLVKKNEQLDRGGAGYGEVEPIVRAALSRNATFAMAVRPRLMRPILFNRYAEGMSYGPHVDDPLMGYADAATSGQPPIRTDVAFTLFLADPGAYDGGELVVNHSGGEQRFKLPAGGLIAYPACYLHRVEPVTRGARLAAFGWVQSEVRDPSRREILFELDTVRRTLFQREGKSALFDQLSKSFANLLRMWAES